MGATAWRSKPLQEAHSSILPWATSNDCGHSAVKVRSPRQIAKADGTASLAGPSGSPVTGKEQWACTMRRPPRGRELVFDKLVRICPELYQADDHTDLVPSGGCYVQKPIGLCVHLYIGRHFPRTRDATGRGCILHTDEV